MVSKCPKCGSENSSIPMMFRNVTNKKKCNDCGYEGIFVEVEKQELSEKDNEVLKDMKNV